MEILSFLLSMLMILESYRTFIMNHFFCDNYFGFHKCGVAMIFSFFVPGRVENDPISSTPC